MSHFVHTAETDARIRQGYEAGERIAVIAAAIGANRNVVIGRANRMGLQKPGRQYMSEAWASVNAHMFDRTGFAEKCADGYAKYQEKRKGKHSTNAGVAQ